MINVVIPSFNCLDYIERCLKSVHDQTYKNFRVVLIDDASTQDGYFELCNELTSMYGFMFHRNETNMKCPYNIKLGIELLDLKPDDIVFILDGDDFIPENALERIVKAYEDHSVWLTYGNYKPYPKNTGQTLASQYPRNIVKNRDFRTAPSHFNHPITFKKFLWDQIEDKDLQTENGVWFTGGYDRVLMAPMLEMAWNHYLFIDETLYFYNAVNPNSDVFVNLELINESDQVLNRPKKRPLNRRFNFGDRRS